MDVSCAASLKYVHVIQKGEEETEIIVRLKMLTKDEMANETADLLPFGGRSRRDWRQSEG